MWHEQIINTCILRKKKKSLAEAWLNLQTKRVDNKLQELGVCIDFGYIVFEQGTQHPTKEKTKLQISQAVMKCPFWLKILGSPLTNSIMLLKLTWWLKESHSI